uniref:Putative glucan endo-1,3-beta-glucosidase GVI n=1 Tax=Davidia involucrata TaxID=16924 RepID=A0A5B7BT18_DAVIN
MDLILPHSISVFLLLLAQFHRLVGGQAVGVNYGMLGDDLPSPDEVVALCKSRNIQKLRLFNPDAAVLRALENSGIEVILGTLNADLVNLANDKSFVTQWVEDNIKAYVPAVKFRYIALGNEVIPSKELAEYVLPAMQNIKTELEAANLWIPVSTCVFQTVLGPSDPPSITKFSEEASPTMVPIVQFLEDNGYPLLFNVYPYFAYRGDPENVGLDYALFNASGVVLKDGAFEYQNLFDAMMDTIYWALKKAGAPNVEVVVSESGWPSGGNEEMATIENAQTYNSNLIAHVMSGTPMKPGKGTETYLFALFNENLKGDGTEQHYGLFYPNMTQVYPLNF